MQQDTALNTPLTIIDPNGQITADQVSDYLCILGAINPLRVIRETTTKDGATIIFLDHRLKGVSYHDEALNDLLAGICNYFIALGCEFTTSAEVLEAQASKIRGR